MKTDEFIEILETYFAGHATEEEKYLIKEYFDLKDAESSRFRINVKGHKDKVFAQIESSIFQKRRTKSIPIYTSYWAIAASFLLMLGLFLLYGHTWEPQYNLVETTYGQKQEIQLADGSLVVLNSGSSLKYPQRFDEETREVELSGEAFFKVKKDTLKPFIIKTDEVRTRVLGTSFNINAFAENDSITVSVSTGKVLVANNGVMKEILLPNEQLHYHKTSEAYRKTNNKALIDRAWTQNTIYLNNKTLKETAKILERWFNVSIEIQNPDLNKKMILGKYHNPKLKQTLESLSFLLKVEFLEKSPFTYTVTPKNPLPM